ncbi:MAG: sialate O-acetylesterase [Bacteroidales bacterium]|nr:sialate O-acetylesterase [Bacteroidales bacterium]
MKSSSCKIIFVFILSFLIGSIPISAKLIMPVLFSDNMVLQQKTEAPIWGQCESMQKVKVKTSWDNKTYETISDRMGNWKLKVQTPLAGGPYTITVSAEKTIRLNDVMIGEVWLCSGQSNMEMPLAGWGKISNFENEVASADHPNIRLFQVEKATALQPVSDLRVMGGSWLVCSPKSISEFSATAYFFAKNLSKKLKGIPIGLIHTSWGGTPVEAWTSSQSLMLLPDFNDYLRALKEVPTDSIEQKKYLDNQLEAWKVQIQNKDKDPGYKNGIAKWIQIDYDDEGWKMMNVPQLWEEQMLKNFDGVVWFRKTIDLPESLKGKDLNLNLGTIDDNEITFFNGQQIGTTEGWDHNRAYIVPGNLVKVGKNVITVRVFDSGGSGGFYGDPQKVFLASGEKTFNLSGSWKYSIGFNLKEITAPIITQNQSQPAQLFNAMINPLVPYAIRGAIWYQGEANVDRAKQYKLLFPLMIYDWRKQWNDDFPFYFVQLANYLKSDDKPQPSPWAELREAQQNALSLDNTGMAVTIDIGNPDDIHPKNKQEVGRRLALLATVGIYGQQEVSSGPRYESYKIHGSKIILKFSSVGGGLKSRNGEKISGFAVAGVDKKFYWANAEIQDNKVILSCPEVEFPISVRYGWSNNPACNLYNAENLPAAPFRTDDWDE